MYQISMRKVAAKEPLTRVAWMVWYVADTGVDDSVLVSEHVSQMKMLYWCYCQPCLLFSSSHKKLGLSSPLLLLHLSSSVWHTLGLLRPRMMWEAEYEFKIGALSWQRLF